jgi:hypothetical protein
MPMWRCPHCRTPQAESARCWVCQRSSIACGACRHFRRSVAAQLGYCGLDKRRLALTGDEVRACWEAPLATGSPASPSAESVAARSPDGTDVRRLDFVPVLPTPPVIVRVQRPPRRTRRAGPESELAEASVSGGQPEPRWSLWSDLEG